MWRRNSLAKGLLLAVLSLAVSCKTSDDAVALAAQMTAAANSLCDYYAALAQIVDNHASSNAYRTQPRAFHLSSRIWPSCRLSRAICRSEPTWLEAWPTWRQLLPDSAARPRLPTFQTR